MRLLIGVSGVQWSTFSVWCCANDSSGPKWALPGSCLHSVHMARMVVSAVLCAYRRVVAETAVVVRSVSPTLADI